MARQVRSPIKLPGSASPVLLQWSLSKTALEIQIEDRFWTLYLPQSSGTPSAGGLSPAVNGALQDMATQDPIVRQALLALACVCVARINRDVDLERQATEGYVRALGSVNAALQHPATAQTDATLLACRVLGSYEMFRPDPEVRIGTQAADWKRHVVGVSRLMELRGRDVLVEPPADELFVNIRMASWISTLLWRGRYGLDGDSSLNLPRRTPRRTHFDRFLDIVENLPPLLHRLDRPGPEGVQKSGQSSLRNIYFTLVGMGERLRAWEREALADCVQESGSGALEPGSSQETFASIFESRDHCWKVTIIYYWTACLVVHTTLSTAHKLLTSLSDDDFPCEVAWPGWLDPFSHATLISEHLESLFCPEAGLWGSQNGALPFALCIHFVAATAGAYSREWRRLTALILRHKVGGGIKDFMRSLANDTAPEGFTGDPSVKEDAEELGSLWFWGWASKPGMLVDGFL